MVVQGRDQRGASLARRSIDDYIKEALEAAEFAANTDLRPQLNTTSPGLAHPRYPGQRMGGKVPVAQHAGHMAATTGGEDIGPIIQALVKASGGRVTIKSGKRSPERQAQLFAAAVRKYGSEKAARKWVAPPGRSRHQTGAAYDLGGDLALAAKLAPQFGLHRPMSWEPWHFERIGSRRK